MIKNHFSKLAKFILNKKKGLTVFICVLVCVVPCALLLKSHKPLFNPYLTKAPSNSNYLYQNTKNPFKVYLGSRQDEKKPTARFEVGENKFVEFEAENLNAKDAKLEANKVWRYEDVRDNVDLTYKLTEKGLKEEIILNKPIGPISQISPIAPEETGFSFLLSYPKEMEIKERTPNELAFYEKDGPYLFHFQKPFMQDAKGEKTENVKIKVIRAKPSIPTPGVDKETPGVEDNQLTYRLTFVPDQNWLNDSNRKYPVVIDPTIIHDTPSEFDDGTFNRTTDSGSGSQTSKLETSFEELPADINTVGLWHMNETSGSSVADSSGNSNTGTATGTTIVDGKFGKARSFNGSSDYIDLGAPASLNINPPLTVEMWIKRDTNDTDGGWLFLGNNNTDSGTKNGLVLASNFKIYADQYPGSGTSTIGSTIIGTNQWYHIAAIFDTSQTYVYVNGQLDGQAAAETYTGVTPTKWLIGTRLYPTNSVYYFNGLIDEVRINNVALSPEEIKAHANRRPYGIYTSPVIDFGQTPASLNALNWVDNITPPTLPSGWTKVKPVLIDNTQNSSALTNHQVKVHVDYDSNMQSDFDDLKFTNSSGTNLDYWIESKSDGVEATVWVEVDTIPASSWTTIFMFYGNSGASAASNIANTFVYGQAFTAANGTDITTFSGWSKDVDNSSTYTIDTNRLKMYHPGAAPNEARDGAWYTFGTQLDTNNMVEYKITIADSDSWDYMGEVTDNTWANMGSNVSSKTAINNETWSAYTASAWSTIQSSLTVNRTYKFSIRINGSSQVWYYTDDVYKAVYACQTSCSNIKNLVFGNYGYATGNDTWYIDDLRVRKYTSPEPSASVGASVEFETRTSADNSTWEAWKPITNETAITSMDSDASNWSWDSTATYMPQAKSNESTIKIEGSGSLKQIVGQPQVVDANTVGLWHMEETNGNAYDSSGLINTLTANNSPGSSDGFFGKSRTFNGSNQYFSCTDANCGGTSKLDYPGSGGWSFGAWIKPSLVDSNYHQILSKDDTSAGNSRAYALWLYNNNTIAARLCADGACATNVTQTGTTVLQVGKWYYATAVYNGSNLKIYVNGVLEATSGTYSSGINNSTSSFAIGVSPGQLIQYFNGTIDEVFVKNVALSAEEIAEAYRAGRDHRLEKTISSTDLSAKNKIPFYVASDRPGTNLEAYIGETTNSVYGADTNTVGLWHMEEKSESWGDTFPGTTIDTTKWVEIDPNANKISQSTGLVLSAGTVAAWDSGVISKANFTRQTANQLYARFTTSSSVASPNHMMVGWGQDQTANASYTTITHALYFAVGTFYVFQDGTCYAGPDASCTNNVALGTYVASTAYEVLITLASNGTAKYEVKGGVYTNWTTLLAADAAKTNSPLRAQVAQYQHTGTFNEIRVYPSISVKDSSTSANNGTTYGTSFTQGKIGKGRYFNGSSDYVSVPASSGSLDIDANPVTLEAWIKPDTVSATQRVVSRGDTGNSGYGMTLGSTGKFNCGRNGGSNFDSISTLTAGQWYHVVCITNSSSSQIYINGVLDQTGTVDVVASAGNLSIGAGWDDSAYTEFFDGIIDEVRISNTARSAEEIQQTYQYGLRTHQITTDFVTNPQATYASGTSITINNPWGTTNLTDTLSVGDTMIIRQNENGTEYISQAEVSAITNTSSTYGTVTLASAFSSIPPSGYTTNAKVFKWQREYWDIKDISPEDRGVTGGITKLGVRVLDGSQGFTFYLDDFRSNSNYLYLPFGNTITSTANRYFQYRAIITGTDSSPTSSNTQSTPTPQISRVMVNYTLASDEKDGRPVAQWKFDEGYGSTAYDETINNHDATLNSMESTDWVAGYQGKALNLGGTDEYLSVANSADVNFGDHSMSISVFVNISQSGATYPILGKYSSSKGYNLYINSTGKVIFQVGDGTNTPSVTSNKSVNDGKWHSILAVRTKGSTLKIYIDGIYDNQVTDTADNIDSTGDVVISEAAGYIGKLDELNLYDYVLSASQAKVVYNKGYSAVLGATEDVNKGGAGPVGFWKMDEATGITTNDSSGNGNTGTITGATWTSGGKIGNALSFNGSSDYVALPNSETILGANPTAYSYSTWFKSSSSAAAKTIISDYDSASGSDYNYGIYAIINTNSLNLEISIRSSGNNYSFDAGDYDDGTWHFLTVVVDKSVPVMKAYVDGILRNSMSIGNYDYVDAVPVRVGAIRWNEPINCYFSGEIDHVKIYNYARTVAQIHADMAGSPVAYWKFDESYGTTAYDETTNNNDGTLTDFPTSGAWVNGKFGKALNFDGNNDYVVTGESTSLDISGTTGTTQTAWVKLDSLPSGSPYAITMTTETGQGSETWDKGIRITTGGKATFYVYDGAKKEAVGNTTLQTGVWYHLTGLYDGTNVKIYVNGQDDGGSTTASSTYNFTTPQLVMSFYNETVYFDGQIDEVKIYNYSLTADEIKVEYNQNSAVRLGNTLDVNAGGSGPLGWWKFDEGSGQTIHNLGSAQDLNPSYLGGDSGSDNMDPSWTTNGKIGNALQFDGSGDSPYNDRVTINDTSSANSAALDITENLSVSLWFYADNSNAPNSYWYDIARTTQTECNQYWADVGPQEFTTQDTWGGSMYDWWCGAWDQTNNNWTYYGGSYDQCTYNLTTHYHYAHIGCGAQGIRPRLLEKGHSYRLKYASGSVYGYINKEEVSSVVSSGAWHHVELTYDKSYIRLYIDGNLKTSSPYSESIKYVNSISSQIILKEPLEVGYGFTGKIDDVRIYNYARSQKQVDMDYNGGKPTAHWKLDEATGTTAYDESDNNNDGILTNMEDADHVNGKIGRALEFDGVDEYVNAGTGSSLMPSALTLSAWVKPGGSASGSYETIISKWDTVAGVNHRSYMLSIYDMSTFRFMISSNGQDPPGGNVCDSTTDLVAGVWYHVVATFDGSTLKIYVNGILENQKSQSGIYSSSDPTGIGATMGRTADAKAHYLDGLIDEVKLYNYARTADEVKLDYNNGAVSFK